MKLFRSSLFAIITLGTLLAVNQNASASDELINLKEGDIASVKEHKSSAVAAEEKGVPGMKIEYNADHGYPGVRVPAPPEGWDLSAYEGVKVTITNTGSEAVTAALRVDNKGGNEPYNTEPAKIAAGETKTIEVRFGYSYGGNPAYQLDPSQVVGVQIFVSKPAANGSLFISNLVPFGTAGTKTESAKTSAAPAGTNTSAPSTAAGGDNLNAPSIGGELINFGGTVDLSKFKQNHVTASLDGKKIKVDFQPTTAYPTLAFPVPQGGWNLSAFGGVQAEVTNPGSQPVTVVLRVDNPGDWKQSPWNSRALKIPAGETKTIEVVFGQKENGSPGFPLDPTKVTAIQLFITKPTHETTLLVSNLKAFGSPQDRKSTATLSSPEDRNKPVTPPDWLGKRPPVEGNWVETFNENFDGATLNEKLWKASTSSYSKFYIYQPDNVKISDGTLKLTAQKKAEQGREYTSGQVEGFGKWAQSYGYFEAKVKLPTTRGFWPAFWLMPDRDVNGSTEQQAIWDRNTTKRGGMEFDILEHLCEWGPGRHNVALHWDGYNEDHKQWGDSNVYYGPTPDGWHVFGMLWEPGKVTWYIDGIKKVEWENERVGSVPAHMLLSLQMGGWATKDVDLSKIDEAFEVDYVRVWQLKERL